MTIRLPERWRCKTGETMLVGVCTVSGMRQRNLCGSSTLEHEHHQRGFAAIFTIASAYITRNPLFFSSHELSFLEWLLLATYESFI